jgi:hypothetical protein
MVNPSVFHVQTLTIGIAGAANFTVILGSESSTPRRGFFWHVAGISGHVVRFSVGGIRSTFGDFAPARPTARKTGGCRDFFLKSPTPCPDYYGLSNQQTA